MQANADTTEKMLDIGQQQCAKDCEWQKDNWRKELWLAQNGNSRLKDKILSENIGLIHMVLRRFAGRGYEMEDLFQIGAIGLLKAIERFDVKKEVAFSTYAVPMIIGEIQRFLRDDGMIHISRQIKDNARKIAIAREKIRKSENCEPTMERLSLETGIDKEDIATALEANVMVDSISRPITSKNVGGDEGKELTLADQLMDEKQTENHMVDRIVVHQMLEQLGEKEQKLMLLRYMEGKTQTETAQLLSMNQVAVSRLEKKILLQLREHFGYNKAEENKR